MFCENFRVGSCSIMIKNKHSLLVGLSLLVLGFSGLIAQILLVRELTATFSGNELSLGIILGNWLLGTAMGSLWARRVNRRSVALLISFHLLLPLLLYVQVYLARTAKSFLGFPFYELLSPGSIFLISFLALIPYSFLCGFGFVFLSKLYVQKKEKRIGKAYLLETIGATGGGLLSYLLVRFLAPFQICALLGILNTAMAFSIGALWLKNLLRTAFTFILLLAQVLFLFTGSKALEKISAQRQWKGRHLVEYEHSLYGNISVIEEEGEYNIYENGELFFSSANKEAEEENVHLSLLQHPFPKKILFIGGGLGYIEEILKHPIEKVDYVQLDPQLIQINKNFLSPSQKRTLTNSKVNIHLTDARAFIRTSMERYDVVILNLPDPVSLQINRVYTKEFFQEVGRILNKRGIFVLHIFSSSVYLNPQLIRYNISVYNTLKAVFPYTLIIPGENLYLFASFSPILTYKINTLEKRWEERRIVNKYFTLYHLWNKIDLQKIDYVKRSLKRIKSIPLNMDFHPVSFYYYLIVHNSFFYPSHTYLLEKLSTIKMTHILLFSLLLLFFLQLRKTGISQASKLCIFTSGFAGLSLETVILLCFQIIYGYIYSQIGMIIACFMAGLGMGSYLSSKRLASRKFCAQRALSKLELSISAYALLLPFIFSSLSKPEVGKGVGLFFFLSGVIGTCVGAEYPLANHLLLKEKDVGGKVEKAVGTVYSADLLGGLSGAILTSLFLIPLLGIFSTCTIVAMSNLMTLILISRASSYDRPFC